MILKFLGRGSVFNVKEGNNSAYIKYSGDFSNVSDVINKYEIDEFYF